MKKLALIFCSAMLSACLGMPASVTPVQNFDLERYLGKWYEIARLDHSFERGLEQVSANYSLREDGGVDVINRGYSATKQAWKTAKGKAYFVGDSDEGYLKVSFFGPFYGSYVIFEIDKENYDYAFISGPDSEYLWFLSRSPKPSTAIMQRFKQTAKARGFDVSGLIFVNHESTQAPQ